jgi:hypothetical protein
LEKEESRKKGSRSVFFDLSRMLSDSERNELLYAINKSLKMESRNSKSGEERNDDASDEAEVKLRLKQELKRIGLFEHFFLWLRKLISGKRYEELMLELKMDQLKKSIRRQAGNITGFETRDLRPAFAEMVWKVYEESFMLQDCFEKLFGKKGLFRDVMITFFQEELSGTIKEPEQIFSFDEMVEIYRREGSDEAVRREGNRALQEELEQVVDIELISRLERRVVPLIAAEKLVRFPFSRFFSAFGLIGIDPKDFFEATGKTPAFKSATAITSLDLIEQLYRSLFRFIEGCKDEPLEVETAAVVGNVCWQDDDTPRAAGELFLEQYNRFFQAARNFYDTLPLPDLIRYFRKNPFYRIRIVHERMDLKAFFLTARKIIMREYIEERLVDVREEATERNIKEIFSEGDIERLKNYRTYQSISYDELGIPVFNYQRSLALMLAFCSKNYKRDILESVRILDKGLYALNRVERDRLLMHSNTIDDVESEIEELDKSLSSEEAEGKMFQRLRFTIASDPGQQRLFKSLVQKKDKEAASLVRRGREAVEGLTKLFEDTLKVRNEAGIKALNQHYFIKGTPVTLRSILDRNIATMRRFSFIMEQIKRVEP